MCSQSFHWDVTQKKEMFGHYVKKKKELQSLALLLGEICPKITTSICQHLHRSPVTVLDLVCFADGAKLAVFPTCFQPEH